MKVLIACEFSGIVRNAFTDRGHDAWSCDLLPTERSGNHIQDDILKILNQNWDLMIAHPPCTYLCVSGARWFYHDDDKNLPINKRRPHPKHLNRKKYRDEAVIFFMELINADINKICVENPVGYISTIYRKPNQIIQPYEYGHTEAKKTCLWLKNLPKLTSTKIVEPEYITYSSGKRMSKWYAEMFHLPKNIRAKERSRTFIGVAKAMAEQWG